PGGRVAARFRAEQRDDQDQEGDGEDHLQQRDQERAPRSDSCRLPLCEEDRQSNDQQGYGERGNVSGRDGGQGPGGHERGEHADAAQQQHRHGGQKEAREHGLRVDPTPQFGERQDRQRRQQDQSQVGQPRRQLAQHDLPVREVGGQQEFQRSPLLFVGNGAGGTQRRQQQRRQELRHQEGVEELPGEARHLRGRVEAQGGLWGEFRLPVPVHPGEDQQQRRRVQAAEEDV